jgi:hypothetical protein
MIINLRIVSVIYDTVIEFRCWEDIWCSCFQAPKKRRLQIFLANEQSGKTTWFGVWYILNEMYIHKSLGSGRPRLKVGINNDGL